MYFIIKLFLPIGTGRAWWIVKLYLFALGIWSGHRHYYWKMHKTFYQDTRCTLIVKKKQISQIVIKSEMENSVLLSFFSTFWYWKLPYWHVKYFLFFCYTLAILRVPKHSLFVYCQELTTIAEYVLWVCGCVFNAIWPGLIDQL